MKRALIAATLLLPVLTGCSQAVAGTPQPSKTAATQLAADRDCQRAVDAGVQAIATFINHADADPVEATQGLENGPIVSMFGDMGAKCGPARGGWAFSQVLVRVADLKPATPIGRYALNELLKGLCPDPGESSPVTLDRNAQAVCAGR